MIKVLKGAWSPNGVSLEGVVAALSATFVRQAIAGRAANSINLLTDNSTGDATKGFTIPAKAKSVPADGNSLAQKAATEAAIAKVQIALATLYAKANAVATLLGLDVVVYNGGGVSGGDTIPALTKATTAAATGPNLAAYETNRLAINGQFTRLKGLVEVLCAASNVQQLADVSGETAEAKAITADTGAAATPGVTKAKVDADLTAWASNVAALAAKLNAVLGVDAKPLAIVVQ